MSPVNEEEPIEEHVDPVIERLVTRTRGAMGVSASMPARVIVLLIVIVIAVTFSPTPANIIGVAAATLLALDIAQHRR